MRSKKENTTISFWNSEDKPRKEDKTEELCVKEKSSS